jgi:protein arginine N-methyltransferase 1
MHFYNFVGYCSMLTDEMRVGAYVKALKEVINSESVVLDLGAGTGIFSILACEFGAKKVYSVEVNQLINLLKDVVKEKGYESRIEIIQNLSTKIELKEKANVLISDIHGGFPLFESSIETIIDARERLLTEDAILMPRKETIYFAVSQTEEIYKQNISQYLEEFHGFRIPSAERLVFNQYFSAKDKSEKLLTEPGVLAEINYRTIKETSFEKEFQWEFAEDGTAHGLRGWFENELFDDIGVSNSIEIEKTTYSSPFFPFEKVVEIKKGDTISAHVSAKYQSGDYVWSWKTQIFENGDKNKIKADFNQSQLASMYLDSKQVMKKSEYFVPVKNETAEIDLFILDQMDGENMQGDIADTLVKRYSERFKSFDDAIDYLFGLSQRYCK